MGKIKTREKVKDIKVLDKSAVAGQRMKDAFIRSKDRAAELTDDRQATPGEYAGDKVQLAADDAVHDAANVAVSGTKTAAHRGKEVFQQHRAKKAAEQTPEAAPTTKPPPTGQPTAPLSTPRLAPEGRRPQQPTNPVRRQSVSPKSPGAMECQY